MALSLSLLIFTTLAVLGHGLSLESNDESADRVSSRLLRREDSGDRKAVGQSDPDELTEPTMDAEDEEAEEEEQEEEIQDGTMMSLSTAEPEVLAEGQDASVLQENQTGGSSSQSSKTSLEEGSDAEDNKESQRANPGKQKSEASMHDKEGNTPEKYTKVRKDMKKDEVQGAERAERTKEKIHKSNNRGKASALEVAKDDSKTKTNHQEEKRKELLHSLKRGRVSALVAQGPNTPDCKSGMSTETCNQLKNSEDQKLSNDLKAKEKDRQQHKDKAAAAKKAQKREHEQQSGAKKKTEGGGDGDS